MWGEWGSNAVSLGDVRARRWTLRIQSPPSSTFLPPAHHHQHHHHRGREMQVSLTTAAPSCVAGVCSSDLLRTTTAIPFPPLQDPGSRLASPAVCVMGKVRNCISRRPICQELSRKKLSAFIYSILHICILCSGTDR